MNLIKEFMRIGGFSSVDELEAYGEDNFFRDFPEARKYKKGGSTEAFPQAEKYQTQGYGPVAMFMLQDGGEGKSIPQAADNKLSKFIGSIQKTAQTAQRKEILNLLKAQTGIQTEFDMEQGKDLSQFEVPSFTPPEKKKKEPYKDIDPTAVVPKAGYNAMVESLNSLAGLNDSEFKMPVDQLAKKEDSAKDNSWIDDQKGLIPFYTRQFYKGLVLPILESEGVQRALGATDTRDQYYTNIEDIYKADPVKQGTFDFLSQNNFSSPLNRSTTRSDAFNYMSKMGGPVKTAYIEVMKHGGSSGFNQIAPMMSPNEVSAPDVKVNSTLQPVPRNMATIEAEKGETAFVLNENGLPAHYKIGGKRHSKGGTPLDVPQNTFIFSDTRSMTLKDPELLEVFNEKKPKTFAEIAKKYDLNKYRKVLADPNSDKLQRETAEMMIGNYTTLLGKLALAQESMKGFPQGIPMIAEPFMATTGTSPEEILPMMPPMPQPMGQMPMMQAGGFQPFNGASEKRGSFTRGFKAAPPATSEPDLNQLMNLYGIQPQETPADANALVNLYGLDSSPVQPTAVDPTAGFAGFSPTAAGAQNIMAAPKGPKTGTSRSGRPSDSASEKDLMEFRQEFWDEYNNLGAQGLFVNDLPGVNFTEEERKRKSTQGQRDKSNIYGDRQWNTGAEWDDFKRRQDWFFKDNPNFDPNNKEDVKRFQQAYCERARSFGMKSCYFQDNGKSGTGFDGKFGEHTWSAPGFNTPAEIPAATIVEGESKKPDKIQAKELEVQQRAMAPFSFYPQDIANLAVAGLTQIPRPKTFYQPLSFRGVEPAYLVPDYSPITEAAAISTAGINAYGSRQGADASLAKIQGMAASQAARHNTEVANLNAGIYNQAEQTNAQIANANAQYNAMQKQLDFDAREAYKADRIKARNKKLAHTTDMWNNALTNAVETYNLNQLYPHYQIFPETGGLMAFTQGEKMVPNRSAAMSPRVKEYLMLKEQGFSHEEAIDIVGRQTSKAEYPEYGTGVNNPYGYPVVGGE